MDTVCCRITFESGNRILLQFLSDITEYSGKSIGMLLSLSCGKSF